MIPCHEFFNALKSQEITFFTGVPDSLLKDLCAYITDNTSEKNHIIAANEGNAIALATGHYLATGKIGVVYMQNSGLGNSINPLTSLTDKAIYAIPLLLIIGWRGEPGKKDEPQHVKKGLITLGLLNVLGISYSILPQKMEEAKIVLDQAVKSIQKNGEPYALIIRDETFQEYKLQNNKWNNYPLTREQALEIIVPLLKEKSAIVSTTGKTSRELFELRRRLHQSNNHDFLTVGSMGHASSIALGIALAKPDWEIYCFDGDGAFIMHLGSLAIAGQTSPKNLKHIIFNNTAHDSVGGQPTAGDIIDIPTLARASGYKYSLSASTPPEIREAITKINQENGPALLEIKTKKGARENLGRPTLTPLENKSYFMKYLQSDNNENNE